MATRPTPPTKQHGAVSKWSKEDRENLAVEVAVCGSVTLASKRCGIPPTTAKRWVNEDPDFKALLKECNSIWHLEQGSRLREASKRSADRLIRDLGDDSVAISPRDLAFIAGITLDKSVVTDRVLQTGSATGEGVVKEVFSQLKDMFDKQAQKPAIDGVFVEGEVVEPAT